jgi:hypothetical protein
MGGNNDSNRAEARRIIASVDRATTERLLVGAIDLHVHSGPSIMARQVDHFEAVEQAAAAGMRGILFKDHHYSVGPFLPIMERLLGQHGVKMFGSLVLNNTTGGLNPAAVEYHLKSGTSMIFMPTAHAANHIRSNHRGGKLATNVKLRAPKALTVVDDTGQLLDAAKEILDIVAEHDAILSSGHLHVSEILTLFREAKQRGVNKLVTNHPMYGLHFEHVDTAELAAMGVIIEQSACLYVDSRFNTFSPQEFKEHIEAAGVANSAIGSDLGQVDNPSPVEGLRQAVALCLGLGFSEADVTTMIRKNPGSLVGMETRG